MINLNQPGTSIQQFEIAGETRSATVVIPEGFKPALGKIFFFFKGQDDAKGKITKVFYNYLKKENFIGVFPEAMKRKGDKKKQWAVIKDDYITKDILFFGLLVEMFPSSWKFIVSGVSNGGCFAILLANKLQIKYLSTFAASVWQEILPIKNFLNIYAVHGKLDLSVPFDGGYAHQLDFLPAAISIYSFVGDNDCFDLNYTIPGNGHVSLYSSSINKCTLIVAMDSGHDVMTSYKGIDLIQNMFDFFKPIM